MKNNSKFRTGIIHIRFKTSDNSLKTGLKIHEFRILVFITKEGFRSSVSD
jgi:hypothetical protein